MGRKSSLCPNPPVIGVIPGNPRGKAVRPNKGAHRLLMRFLCSLEAPLHTREVAGSKPAAPIVKGPANGLISGTLWEAAGVHPGIGFLPASPTTRALFATRRAARRLCRRSRFVPRDRVWLGHRHVRNHAGGGVRAPPADATAVRPRRASQLANGEARSSRNAAAAALLAVRSTTPYGSRSAHVIRVKSPRVSDS
jgi:hypothetical protein